MKRFALWILASMLLPATVMASEVNVTVTPTGPNQHHVKLNARIEAHMESVWALLTAYNHHAEILPYISRSVVLSSSPLTVEQVGTIRILFWTFTMRVVQRITESPPVEMRFQALEGDFQRLEGRWRLVPENSGTRVDCDFFVQPKRRVPTWAVRMAARHYLANMLQSLQKRAEKL